MKQPDEASLVIVAAAVKIALLIHTSNTLGIGWSWWQNLMCLSPRDFRTPCKSYTMFEIDPIDAIAP